MRRDVVRRFIRHMVPGGRPLPPRAPHNPVLHITAVAAMTLTAPVGPITTSAWRGLQRPASWHRRPIRRASRCRRSQARSRRYLGELAVAAASVSGCLQVPPSQRCTKVGESCCTKAACLRVSRGQPKTCCGLPRCPLRESARSRHCHEPGGADCGRHRLGRAATDPGRGDGQP